MGDIVEKEIKPVKKGIVGFVENKDFLIKEVCVLYQSIKQLDCPDIDFILFGTGQALRRLPSEIIKVEVEPYSKILGIPNYNYINSIGYFKNEKATFLQDYDYLLRTDVDTFILPKFKDYCPKLYTVGEGGYCNDENTKNNLKKIAEDKGLRYREQHNLGSTHYGNGNLVRNVAALATDLSVYILNNYFKYSEGRWPGWYRGVTTMYANELAVNHLVDTFQINRQLIDYPSTNDELVSDHMHIHCWHTRNMFSKFDFIDGVYDKYSTEGLDLKKVRNYCLDTALKSRKYYR